METTFNMDNTTVSTESTLVSSIPTINGTIEEMDNFSTSGPLVFQGGLISKSQHMQARFVIFHILIPCISLIGAAGNSMSLAILRKHRENSSFHIFLTALTVSDVVVLCFGIIRSISQIIPKLYPDIGLLIEAYCNLIVNMFLGIMFSKLSASLIVLISVERFLAVLKPLKVKTYFISTHPNLILMAVCGFQLLVHIPAVVWLKVSNRYDPISNTTQYYTEYADWAKDLTFRKIYYVFVVVVNMLLPVGVVLITNVGIAASLKRQRRIQGELNMARDSGGSIETSKTFMTLLAIGIFFLVSMLPSIVTYIVAAVDYDGSFIARNIYFLHLVVDIGVVLIMLNSANNFVIYILLSKRFKLMFFQTYGCLRVQNDTVWTGAVTSVSSIENTTVSLKYI